MAHFVHFHPCFQQILQRKSQTIFQWQHLVFAFALYLSRQKYLAGFFGHHSSHRLNPRLANTELVLANSLLKKIRKAGFLVFPAFTSCSATTRFLGSFMGFNPRQANTGGVHLPNKVCLLFLTLHSDGHPPSLKANTNTRYKQIQIQHTTTKYKMLLKPQTSKHRGSPSPE